MHRRPDAQRRRPSLLIALSLLSALIGPAALARHVRERGGNETPDDETLQQAQKKLDAANLALQAHDLSAAYNRASESFALVHSPEALLALGRVAVLEGRLLDAQDLMRRYLADPNLESNPSSPEQQEAQRIADSTHPLSAKLNILGDRGTLVLIDGRLVGALPLSRPLLLSASEHKVELTRGSRHLEDEVRVPVGRLGELRLDLSTRALLVSVLPGVIVLDKYLGLETAETRRLEQAVEEGVQTERLSPLPRELALETAGEPPPGPCPDERRCLLDLAEKCEADYVLRVQVQRQAGAWQLGLELVDIGVGGVAGREEKTCAGCDLEQAAKELAALFAPLYKKAIGRPRGQLDIRSEPGNAEVFLDGERVGRTPYQAAAWAGSRELVLRKADYQEERRTLEVRDGETTQLKVSLQPPPEPEPPPLKPPPIEKTVWVRTRRPIWRIVVGATAVGAGTLLLGLGGSALHFNGQCVGGAPAVGICPQLYNTLAPGIGLTVSGILTIGAGTVLIALPGPRKKIVTLKSN